MVELTAGIPAILELDLGYSVSLFDSTKGSDTSE